MRCSVCKEKLSIRRQCGNACRAAACSRCIKNFAKMQIGMGAINISCVKHECQGVYGQNLIIDLLKDDESTAKFYDRNIVLQAFMGAKSEDERLVWCPFCQFPVCGKNMESCAQVSCEGCGDKFCFLCGAKAHAGKTCDGLAETFLAEGVKRCPFCWTGLEKISGCDDVRCPTCRKHMCWQCGKGKDPSAQFGVCHCNARTYHIEPARRQPTRERRQHHVRTMELRLPRRTYRFDGHQFVEITSVQRTQSITRDTPITELIGQSGHQFTDPATGGRLASIDISSFSGLTKTAPTREAGAPRMVHLSVNDLRGPIRSRSPTVLLPTHPEASVSQLSVVERAMNYIGSFFS